MTTITASLVKTLRERTGAGMMECKKALVESQGDLEIAVETMRKKGMAQADKKAGRIAADGCIVTKRSDDGTQAVIAEINCETDFVAKGQDFIDFADAVAALALSSSTTDIEALNNLTLSDGKTVEECRRVLIAKLGENITVRRAHLIQGGQISYYNHGVKIGVLAALDGGDDALGKDVAMHIAALKPQALDEQQVDPTLIEKERAIFAEQAKQSGKPENIIEKIVQGQINKFLKTITLVNQPFVKDPDQTINQLLKGQSASVLSFVRYEVGEGIEKKVDNFAQEVADQVASAKS